MGTEDTAQPTRVAPPRAGASMAEALDHATVRRMRAFHGFGVGAPVIAMVLAGLLSGDPLGQTLFIIGMAALAASNVVMLMIGRTRAQLGSRTAHALWGIAALGLVPAIYYFGPFSAIVLILYLGVMIVAIGSSRALASAVTGFAIVSHLAIVVPVIAGWSTDVGLIAMHLDRLRATIVEFLIVGLLASGHVIGRWVRRTSADALGELASARRLIGDQQQALAEIHLDVARAQRWSDGRWTGQSLGRWQLGTVIGRGAMGEVYEALGSDGREAAVKVLAPLADLARPLAERFHREMQLAARLASPHVVQVYEVSSRDAPTPYFAMERLRGFDLASRLRDESRLSLEPLIAMLWDVARGLEAAHALGIVHRDLKPHNLFCHAGTWKILDFGVAKLVGSEGTLTEGAIIGTPQYMAPEQASGASVTHLADIYSLGAITYRCLTGRAPFVGNDVAGLVYQVVNDAPQRPSAFGVVSPAVEDVLAVAMAKDAGRRFKSASQFVQELELARRSGRAGLAVPLGAWS